MITREAGEVMARFRAREPDPFAELDRQANAPIRRCRECSGPEVEEPGDRCEDCTPKECSYCGAETDGRWCSAECRRADESDRG